MQQEYRPRPLHIFLSFAPQDRAFRDSLDKHLSSFHHMGLVDDWHKREVPAGSNWQDVIDEQLNLADIILLFITPDFIASNYCYSVQMKQALAKHDAGEVRVIPILLRPTFWYDLPFAKLQGLPTSGNKTVSEWKNKDRAYVEIIEGIKKAIEELMAKFGKQATPPPQTPSKLWDVPHPRNPFFTGRDVLLLSLHATFLQDREHFTCTQAISGLGGIGKTQTALEYAYRYSDEYQAVFWLKGDTSEDLLTDFIRLATLLNLPEQRETDQHIVIAAIKRALSQAPRWLIIIDNIDTFERLDELIPTRGQGDILITTYRQATGASATLNLIEKMPPSEGAFFLLRRAKIIAQNASPDALNALPASSIEQAKTICELVDGLPLALDQAGAYIEETKISLARYITLYQKHEAALLKQRRKFAAGHPSSIATTLALCIAKVKEQNKTFVELLSLCAFLHPDAIPIAVFTEGAPDLGPTLQALISDELEFNAALEALLDLSLLHRNSDTETVSIHRLVQVILRDEMDANIQQLWAERAIKALCRLFPEPELGVWQYCQEYLPHVLVASTLIQQWNLSFPEAARLLSMAGRYLYQIASYSDARRLCQQALTIAEQVHGNEHSEIASTLYCLGNISESLGDYTDAQHLYERALAIGERTWGPEHPDTANILNDLGELFHSLRQFPLAEDYYRRALAIRQNTFGTAHPDTASSLNNIAGICEELGRYAQAEALYEQALQLRERLRGPNHPDTAESLSNVARFYRVIGKYLQAQPLYERATMAYEQALGPEHPRVATCYNNFAVFCIALGQYAQAEQLLTKALKIRTQLFGLHDSRTAGSWNHLARVYTKQGRYEQARALYEQTLSVFEQIFGRHHPRTAAVLINMGEFYLLQGDNHTAEALLTEALASITEGQEQRTLEAAPVLNLLGEVYLARAEYERAEAFYQQALAIVLVSPGPNHPDVITLVEHTVNLLQRMGRDDDARILSERIPTTPT